MRNEVPAKLWLVRLGRFGEQEDHAFKTGELITGWEMGSLLEATTKDAVLAVLRDSFPDEKEGTLSNWAAQLNQFRNLMQPDDLVVVPAKSTGQIAIGRLEGQYSQRGGKPMRRVHWLRSDIPRDALKQDLLYSLGAAQTICEVSRNDAARRLGVVARGGADPGATVGQGERQQSTVNAENEQSNLAELARGQIEAHISTNFVGHAFTQLIASILQAQGYQTQVSPPGPDRGIDIVAGQGALGFDGPRLVVQVKSGSVIADQPTLQGLLGCINDTRAEHGLLVSWSGFKQTVRDRVNELYFRVRLWGRDETLDALFSVYDRLPEDLRANLPLRRLWTLVPPDIEN